MTSDATAAAASPKQAMGFKLRGIYQSNRGGGGGNKPTAEKIKWKMGHVYNFLW